MRVEINLMKPSTEIIDLSKTINPRVGDDDLLLPLHIVYGDNQTDMRGKDVEFISEDTNKQRIYVGGTCNTDTPGDNLYMGNLTFRFPANTFKADGTYDPDKTMFRIVDKATQKVISSVNVKITVMKNSIEFDFDPDKMSYDSRLEEMLHGFHDEGQAMLDDIKNLNDQAKSNVSGDTAATAKEAKQQADANAGDISDLKGEVAGARGRYADLPGREDAQDTAINQKESIVNANANYAALKQKDNEQDTILSQKAGKFEIENKLAQMDLQPEGFENEAALKAKYPNGKPGIMVTTDTGHKWICVNGNWKDCGVYQAASDILKINNHQYTDDTIPNGYTDLNDYRVNEIVSFSGYAKQKIINLPVDFPDGFVTMSTITYGFSPEIDNGTCQEIMVLDSSQNSHMFFRSLGRNSKGVIAGNWISDNNEVIKQTLLAGKGLYTESNLPNEFKDLNNYPVNQAVFYSGNVVGNIKNIPEDLVIGRYYNMSVLTLSFYNAHGFDNGTTQFLSLEWTSNTGINSSTYARTLAKNNDGVIAPHWQKLSDDYETGSLSLFSKIGVIGDSYASGCIAADGADGSDRYSISWPQIMGRACGAQVTNFTHGGANTGLWTTEDYGLSKLNSTDTQDLYICALGINDAAQIAQGKEELGTIADVGSTTSTSFYRYYGDILNAIQAKAPHACVVLTTLTYSPMTMSNLDDMNAAIKALAARFKIPCIDIEHDDFFTSSFYANAIQAEAAHSHPTAPLYAGMAKRIQTLIENDMVVHKNYYDQFPWGHPSLDAPKISVEG